jgi:hypothetical protein
MISDSYPYTQEIFDEFIFQEPYTWLMIPELDEVLDSYISHFSQVYKNNLIESTPDSVLRETWDSLMIRGRTFVFAFDSLNYFGGDFDLIFDQLELEYPTIPWESIEYTHFKEYFILEVMHFVALYKACVLGCDYFDQSLVLRNRDNLIRADILFAQIFSSNLIAKFLSILDGNEHILSNRTHSNNYPAIVRAFVNSKDFSSSHNYYAERVMNPTIEAKYWGEMGLGTQFLQVLEKSENIETKEAVKDCKKAFSSMLELRVKYFNKFR